MNKVIERGAYGTVVEPMTIQIQRRLPGPVDRVWSYLTDSELRRKWLASGEVEMKVGAPFTLTWRNDDLSGGAGARPEGMPAEHSMDSRITVLEPNRRLGFAWGQGEVVIDLEPLGDTVLLTLTHRRISDRENMLKIGAGWHMHLDTLVARMTDTQTEPFWDGWKKLKVEYEGLIPR